MRISEMISAKQNKSDERTSFYLYFLGRIVFLFQKFRSATSTNSCCSCCTVVFKRFVLGLSFASLALADGLLQDLSSHNLCVCLCVLYSKIETAAVAA